MILKYYCGHDTTSVALGQVVGTFNSWTSTWIGKGIKWNACRVKYSTPEAEEYNTMMRLVAIWENRQEMCA